MSIHPSNPSRPFMSHKRKTQIRLGQPIVESSLALVRLRLGISRTRLSELSGVPYETIAGIETGREPKIGTALKLAQALGETVESLWLKGADAKTRHEHRHSNMDHHHPKEPSESAKSPE